MTKNKFKIDAYVAVFLKDNNKILFLKRTKNGWGYGNYTLPGGSVDANESIRMAAIREIKEEVGVDIKEKDLKFLHVTNIKIKEKEEPLLGFYFLVDNFFGEPKNIEPDKCEYITWLDADNLPENIVKELKVVLEKISKNEFYSEIGW
ncbi:MAG: hypothetical protein SZ59_C0003G0114 [candidate division TM6 bacterium GW2011_GWF2_28_16]|nr:MAG: hypothetical protein SZ59_C0003G0114 [candidate division TM6 bacterium GW2011_GWF2_28_16]